MANVQEDRPRLPYGARERRSVGLLVLLFLAVFAAIFFIRNLRRGTTNPRRLRRSRAPRSRPRRRLL